MSTHARTPSGRTPAPDRAAGVDASATVVRQSGLTGVAAAAAVCSGLVLDLTIAATFGATGATDAFVVAARIPLGLLAVLMATANQALVPAMSRWLVSHGSARTSRLVSGVLCWAVLAALVLAAGLGAVAGPLASLLAPGFDRGSTELTAQLIRAFVVVIPLTAGCEVLRAYLNARYSFVVPAGITVVLNLVATSTVLVAEPDVRVLPLAYVAGAAAQFAVLAVFAWRRGLRFVPAGPGEPELRETARLTARPFAAAALNPLARIVELLFVSFLPAGSMTVLHYANRLVSAVGGTVLFRGVVTALVPRMVRAEAEQRVADVDRLTVLGVRMMAQLALPLTAVFASLAIPGAQLVFARGEFSAQDATLLGLALTVYAGSLLGSGLQRALLAPAFAQLDTRTPLRNTVYGVGSNLLLLPVGVFLLEGTAAVLAVAAAYSLSQYVHVAHALHRLRRLRPVDLSGALAPAVVSFVASGAAAAVMCACAALLGLYDRPAPARLLLGLALAAASGLAVFCALSVAFGQRIRLRRGRRTGPSGGGRPAAGAQHLRGRSRQPAPHRPAARDGHGAVVRRAPLVLLRTTVVITAAAVAAALATGLSGGEGLQTTAIVLGGVVAVGLATLAVTHLEAFVLCVLLARASLDALKLPGGGPAGVDPAAVLAVLLCIVVALWMLAQRDAGISRPPLSRLAKTLLVFVAVAALGVVVSPAPLRSLVEWARLASIAPMLIVIEQLSVRPASRHRILVVIYLSAVVPVLVAGNQLLTGSGLFSAGGFQRLTATFTHSNPFSVYLLLLVVSAVALLPHCQRPARHGLVAVLLVTTPLLLLTYTRGSWIAAAVGLVVVGLLQSRRTLAMLLISAVVVVTTVPSVGARFSDLGQTTQVSGEPGNSLAWRLEYWGEVIELARTSPVAGVGLKTVASSTEDGKQPHNDLIRAYVELGVAGLLAYLALLAGFVRAALQALRRTGGAGYIDVSSRGKDLDRGLAVGFAGLAAAMLVLALVANVMTQVVLLWYFVAFAGLAGGAALSRRQDEPHEPEPEPGPHEHALQPHEPEPHLAPGGVAHAHPARQ